MQLEFDLRLYLTHLDEQRSKVTCGPTDVPSGRGPMILLAPMEGLLDCCCAEVLTSVGGVDRCVSSSSASPTS